MEDAGLGTDVVPHTLRHTAATMLRIAGVDVRKGADLLGMAVQTMVRVYGQWTLEGQEEAAETIADIRGMRKAMPLLSLVPSSPQPAVMTASIADDTGAQKAHSARRRMSSASSRSAVSGPEAAKPTGRLTIVA